MSFMDLIYLFDEKTRQYSVTKDRATRIIVFFIGFVCLAISFFVNDVETSRNLMIGALVYFLAWICAVISCIRERKMLSRKISIENDCITLYSSSGKTCRKYFLNVHKSEKITVGVISSPQVLKLCDIEEYYKDALVLYRNMELHKNMSYRSYWNDENILIIQNPEAIAEVEKYIS